MLTLDDFKNYLTMPDNRPVHEIFSDTVSIAVDLAVYDSVQYPKSLLDLARPNEEPIMKHYRQRVYKNPVKKVFGKVLNTLQKIEKAEEYSVSFPDAPPIVGENTLEKYLTEDYPGTDSFFAWFWQQYLKHNLIDPNGVIAVFPISFPALDTEFTKPVCHFFASSHVLAYQENTFAVLQDTKRSVVTVGDRQVREGLILHVFDRDSYAVCTQYGKQESYLFEFSIRPTGYNYMPVFQPGSILTKTDEKGNRIYESILSLASADWDEAIRRESDHQVCMTRHVHPKEWQIVTTHCETCNGKGTISERNAHGKLIDYGCKKCSGTGLVQNETPFGRLLVKPNEKTGPNMTAPVPTPPFGYADFPAESLEFIKREVSDKLYAGLSALNLEFLMERPASASGISKEFDRQESDGFLYGFAKHLINQGLIPCIEFINAWRYASLLNPVALQAQMPQVRIPRKFDMLHTATLADRAKKAKEAGMSVQVVSQLELAYAAREFGETSHQYKLIEAVAELDPLPNMGIDEKTLVLSSGGCLESDFVISCQIKMLVTKAMRERKDFLELDYSDKYLLLEQYAKETIAKRSVNRVPIVNSDGSESNTPA